MGRKLNGFGFWALIFLIPGTGFAQPNVSIEVTPPPAPESAQKDIAEIQKHRATYERGKNLLTAPPLTATPQPEDTPLQERKDAAMERRQQFKSNKLEIQKDRKEKIKAIQQKLDGEAEKIKKAEAERLKKRQQKIVEEAQAEREQKELARQKRHDDIMTRAQQHRKKITARKREFNERKTLAESRRRWKPARPDTPETILPREKPVPRQAPANPPQPTVRMTPAPGVDISISSEEK